jgi:hypothetical protein
MNKKIITLLLLLSMLPVSAQKQMKETPNDLYSETSDPNDYYVRVIPPENAGNSTLFPMGSAVNSRGETVRVTSQSMWWNDRPVIPVMGEMHFSRIPAAEWRNELLKMKAGGINIISTYVFWIHHEEKQGEYDWSGQRNLKAFVRLCKELELKLVLRIGPWCHGEVRNGGFPDWMASSGIKLRDNNPAYLKEVGIWYREIFEQAKDGLWKDGGTIIGIQIENEYRGRWEHLAALKKSAQEAGFDVPLYTRTGWPALSSPAIFGELIPLYGDYADGFWDRSLDEMPGDYAKSYLFRSFRSSTVIATEQLPPQLGVDNPADASYPYFTCELGGGMMPGYHRRIRIEPMDIYAMSLVRVGSGSNLPGYYMYHGGTNPDGKLTYLNEEQATPMTNYNDLPVKTYDFQAPLGEFGQVNEHYHLLRRFHLFLQDQGDILAGMSPFFPEKMLADPQADSLLRWSARSDGHSGFVFVNNYQRLKTLGQKTNVQFTIGLPDGDLTFPEAPLSIASGLSFFLPFNIRLGDAHLIYATAQPVTKIEEDNLLTYFYYKLPGIPAGFVFNRNDIQLEKNLEEKAQIKGNRIYFAQLDCGLDAAFSFRDKSNRLINVVLLDDSLSLSLWKGNLAGKERIFLTGSELICDGQEIRLSGVNQNHFSVAIYPEVKSLVSENLVLQAERDGLFFRYSLDLPEISLPEVRWKKIKEAGKLRILPIGQAKVAESPKDADFEQAAVWQIGFSGNINPERDIYLQFPYIGDVARIYAGEQLITDNFYNGNVFELGLKRFVPEIFGKDLQIKILPLQQDAPVYLQSDAPVDFQGQKAIIDLPEVKVYEKRSVVVFTGIPVKKQM